MEGSKEVKTQEEEEDKIEGDRLSATLFNIAMKVIIKECGIKSY